ncbi:MAG: hypothetical protein ACD_73C00019G0004, partial [uncultured bacterium]
YLFYGLSFLLFGASLKMVHVLTALWIYLGAVFLVRLVSLTLSQTHAAFAGFLFIIFTSSFVDTEIFASNCEILMLTPLIMGVYFLFADQQAGEGGGVWANYFLAGLFTAGGFLFKHQGGINLVVLFLYFIIVRFSGRFNSKKYYWSDYVALLSGFIFPLLVVVAIYLKLGRIRELYEWNILFNFSYVGSRGSIESVLSMALLKTIGFGLATLLPSVLALSLLLHPSQWFKKQDQATTRLILFSVLWLLLSFIPVAMGGRFYGHYYIQLYPPLILLAAIAGGDFILRFARYPYKYRILFVLGIVTPMILFQVVAICRRQMQAFDGVKNYHQEIAQMIKTHSSDKDSIFVWGNYAQAYYFSQRLPASRFVIGEYVVPYWNKFFKHETGFDFNELTTTENAELNLLAADLNLSRPALIIDTSTSGLFSHFGPFQLNRLPPLWALIEQNYHPIINVLGLTFYKRNEIQI